MATAKCFPVGATVILGHTNCRFTSMSFTHISKIPPPMKASIITSSPCTFNRSRCRILCKSSANQVEVVTGCTWTELVVAAEMAVMVEFWSPDCRMMSPVVDDVAREYAGKALCYRVNTEDYPNVATQYGVDKSIPSLLFFKNGEEQERVIGTVVPKSILSATLDKYIE